MKFSCMGIFKHSYENPLQKPQYEERIVLVEANSVENAKKLVYEEFLEYSFEGIELVHAFELKELYEEENSVLEVSSSMKVFLGTTEEYIGKFCSDLRPNTCTDLGWEHVWYNIGHGVSGCYNCQEERNGNYWGNA